jgi:glycosyltransferase involved in cell wall biosynthesis
MNIVHFSTSDLHGGAAKAAYRLHDALRHAGHHSRMIVRDKLSDDPDVTAVPVRRDVVLWRKVVARYVPGFAWFQQLDFNPDLRPAVQMMPELDALTEKVDIICLHWITGLLSSEMIAGLSRKFQCPIVWMLTDQEPYTGGCHYSYNCTGYTVQCGSCPQLRFKNACDRSRIVWKHKFRYLSPLPITFVSSCRWTTECFRVASLFRNHRLEEIGDAMDTAVFRPFDKRIARDLLHIPWDAKVLFFGAFSLNNSRKGMNYLAEALGRLELKKATADVNPFLLCAGHNPRSLLQSLPYPSRALGYLKDDLTLALAYQAADIFVCPSVYEAGAMMVPESMLCGTPVVAFDTGNAPDLIQTMETGYRAVYKDSSDLAHGICTLLNLPNLNAMGAAACQVARQRHTPELVAAKQTALFMALKAEYNRDVRDCHVGQT